MIKIGRFKVNDKVWVVCDNDGNRSAPYIIYGEIASLVVGEDEQYNVRLLDEYKIRYGTIKWNVYEEDIFDTELEARTEYGNMLKFYISLQQHSLDININRLEEIKNAKQNNDS